MDGEEAYDGGTFADFDEAVARARRIVEESVAQLGFDFEQYATFGDDPTVIPTPEGRERFSARSYAKELCDKGKPRSD